MSTRDDEEDMAGLERREATVARREVMARARERDLEADVLGIEGRCRVLHRKATALRKARVPGADALLLDLPRVGPLPGVGDRVRALEARRKALADREDALDERERAIRYLEAALTEAHERLDACSARAAELAEAATRLPPAEPTPPPAANGSERRAEHRARLDVAITLTSADNFFSGFARNLSSGGLFVSTFDLRPVGEAVDVRFSLPGGRTIEARAVVRWVREVQPDEPDIWPGMGLQFADLAPDDALAIDGFMDLREPIFFVD